jgi:hypothetical protein
VARLTQEMIWQKFLILLKRLHLQCADEEQIHSFHQDPSPVKKHLSEVRWNAFVGGIVSRCEYCRAITEKTDRRSFTAVAEKSSIQGCTNPRRTA